MTAPEHEFDSATGENFTPDESALLALLERYLDSLHSSDLGSRSSLIERHPGFAKWMRCLELLDRLAPPAIDGHTPVDAEADAPQPFGKYELFEEIGRGGMGVVFRARQTDLDRTVAVKMILSSRLASSDDVRRFYAEARAAGNLHHPNIVGIHEAGEVNGQHYFSMDFVEGESLAQALARGPFEPRQAAQCAAAVGRAVQYLHEHNVIHRDLKPSNILMVADGTPYVTDFGLAKSLGADAPQTQSGLIVGTLGYMSPEQAGGEPKETSPLSDVYSLGAILFELLTGRPPFRRSNPLDTLLEVMESQPPRPTRLNRNIALPLEWICLKCLEKDPADRYQSAAALVDDLERFLQGEPVAVGPPGVVRSVLRWSRQEPTLASHLFAIGISALIVQLKYMISGFDWPYHRTIMETFALWALASTLYQWVMRRVKRPDAIQYLWAASDAGFLTLMLAIAETPPRSVPGTLLIGYPLLVVTSGLFFRVRLVSFMTVACLLSYGILVVIGREPIQRTQYNMIFAAALGVIGLVIGYQAYRIRVLTGYFEGRRTK